ncbi:uncharacterized protein N7473_003701 [Penicillium subrubescens]|uniref:uncharacterized protein n=1 Tax=Penicillium subrubescens TaxID=1316194 RepID=UPI0025451DB2|nr:uncharacterized protein N7473_003701 [Penicillium subrubescens]KAJ5906785.1 hypothetical protein N7473_003701 [Penicillium subrubescens]
MFTANWSSLQPSVLWTATFLTSPPRSSFLLWTIPMSIETATWHAPDRSSIPFFDTKSTCEEKGV